MSILLTDDREIRRLNRQYRSVDKHTDVLSFPLRDAQTPSHVPPVMGQHEPLGDVVISLETAARQAEEHGHSLQEELNLLVIHGILHLIGYDDESDSAAEIMRYKEQIALSALGAQSRGLISRTRG